MKYIYLEIIILNILSKQGKQMNLTIHTIYRKRNLVL